MRNIMKIYNKVANWLCTIGADKYVHGIVGFAIAYVVSLIFEVTTKGFPLINYAACGFFACLLAMVLKELIDFMRDERPDFYDFLAGVIGGIVGGIIFLL